MLLHPTALSQGMIKLNGERGEIGFPLFTDQDLAERFQASVPPLAHLTLGIAKDREAFLMVLDVLETQGFTHVSLDPTNARQSLNRIDAVRSAIRGND